MPILLAVAFPILRTLLLVSFVLVLAGCGSAGTSSDLPPGPPTSAPPGNLVLYVAMAQGDRIDAYRLGSDGLLPDRAFSSIAVENPRHLELVGNVLYATLVDRIVAMRLGSDGRLPAAVSSETFVNDNREPLELVHRDGILYVASSGLGVIESYELEADGSLPQAPTGAGRGQFPANYVSIELSGDFLYAGARRANIIEIFLLEEDGNVPTDAERQQPLDGISLPDDIEVRDGILYVTSASDKRIRAYRLRPDGLMGVEEDSRTAKEEYYSSIMLDGDTLYAAAYNAGRVDLFRVGPDGMLPEEGPFWMTHEDPAAFPARMLMESGVLYVAQAGLQRVDAYLLGQNGLPPAFPSSSTTPAAGASFPVDLVLYRLP